MSDCSTGVGMHLPSVSTELVSQVRRNGSIDQEEFEELVLHWFPAAASLFWTVQRQNRSVATQKTREEDDTVPLRILKALRLPKPSTPSLSTWSPKVMRLSVPDSVGNKGVVEVRQVLASDAMHRCSETRHRHKLYFENEDTLVAVPDGVSSPVVELPPISLIEERYGHACEYVRSAVKRLESTLDDIGCIDVSRSTKGGDELLTFMSMRPYRIRVEREYGIHLAYQWPGVLAAVPRGSEHRLQRFCSYSEQVLAIHQHS